LAGWCPRYPVEKHRRRSPTISPSRQDGILLAECVALCKLAGLRAHPACAFAAGHHRLIAADGSPIPTTQPPAVQGDLYAALLQNNFIEVPAAVLEGRVLR
jgi:hypothetical protein